MWSGCGNTYIVPYMLSWHGQWSGYDVMMWQFKELGLCFKLCYSVAGCLSFLPHWWSLGPTLYHVTGTLVPQLIQNLLALLVTSDTCRSKNLLVHLPVHSLPAPLNLPLKKLPSSPLLQVRKEETVSKYYNQFYKSQPPSCMDPVSFPLCNSVSLHCHIFLTH